MESHGIPFHMSHMSHDSCEISLEIEMRHPRFAAGDAPTFQAWQLCTQAPHLWGNGTPAWPGNKSSISPHAAFTQLLSLLRQCWPQLQ